MNEHVRLGRIAGIPIGLNWSVMAIFVLVAVGISAGRLPEVAPGRGTALYVVTGVTAAAVFFCSLLLHEMSHAVVARRHGVEVDGIVLWLFGGVAQLRGDAPDPGAAFRIAVAGPAMSLVLGGLFLGLAELFGGGDALLVAEAFRWLGYVNLALGAFNLLPGAPLDGGRVLRAVLWRAHGDERRARIQAARAGQVVGLALIALGVLQFAALGAGGLWLALIGWFLVSAARTEVAQAGADEALSGLTVADVMSSPVITAPSQVTIDDFLDRYVFRRRFSTFPVMDPDGALVGLASVNRVKVVPLDRRASLPLSSIVTPMEDVAVARPEESLRSAMERLGSAPDARLVVVGERGEPVGIVSPVDIVRTIDLRTLLDLRTPVSVGGGAGADPVARPADPPRRG